MDKIKNYENFEVDDPNNESTDNIRQYHLLAKIIIILAVIIVFQIIYILVIYSSIKETNSDISNINLKKYILADGNKKLDRALNEDFKKDYAYDEETKKKDNEIKSKEKLIKDYLHKTKKLQKSLNNTQPIEEIIKINNDKKEKINELKSNLYGHVKGFRDHFYTRIIDSSKELNDIKELIKSNIKNNDVNEINLNMCYSYDIEQHGAEFNYEEANYAINFNENKEYLILFQTNMHGKYGIILTGDNKDNYYLIFDLNNNKNGEIEANWFNFKFDRQNLKLLLNNIKEYHFENKNKEIDYGRYTNITEFEIYKIL
jgi:hypothetical protein